ncbi:MAG: Pr6Pr family membrane protein, partial [Devosiaceae bacterium]|nr:Pr6Pr family membrane protein [Devosiaceae bacterium MH13]
SFLSILTNAMLVGVYAWFISGGAKALRWFRHPTLHAFLAALIVLVGVVWHVLLRPTETVDFHAIGFHYLAPALFVAWWWVRRPPSLPQFKTTLLLMALPLGYAAYVLARGALTGEYPYGFIDVGAVGYAGALPMIGGLSVAQLVLALGLVAVARRRLRMEMDPGSRPG